MGNSTHSISFVLRNCNPFVTFISVFLFLLFILSVEKLYSNNDEEKNFPKSLELYTDGLIEGLMRDRNVPGVTLNIVNSEGILLMKGYGTANMDENKPVNAETTLFRIASVSKTFVWTAAMMLVDRGLLDLNRDVNDYLVNFQVSEAWNEPVTMNHLMAHRAGFEEVFAVFTIRDNDPRPLHELLALHEPRRVFPPGHRQSYSNWGTALAAQVIEDIAGKPFEEFFNDEILKPLGIHSTFLAQVSLLPDTLTERVANSYKFVKGRHQMEKVGEFGPYAPAGRIVSTASDIGRWMRFHLNSGELDGIRLMSEETHNLMLSRSFDDSPYTHDDAHGFSNLNRMGFETFEHGGFIDGFLSNFILVPELDMGVFISQNRAAEAASLFMIVPEKIIQFVADYKGISPEKSPKQFSEEAKPNDLSPPWGTYLSNRRVFTTLAALYGALSPIKVKPAEDEGLIISSGGNTVYYFPVKGLQDIYENNRGTRIAFIRDQKGKVQAFKGFYGATYERQPWWRTRDFLMVSYISAFLLSITTLLGAWRRAAKTGTRKLLSISIIPLISSVGMILFMVITILTISRMLGLSAADLLEYPPGIIPVFRFMAWVVALSALISLLIIPKSWNHKNWSLWRKIHFTVFFLTLGMVTFNMWQWRVLFGAMI